MGLYPFSLKTLSLEAYLFCSMEVLLIKRMGRCEFTSGPRTSSARSQPLKSDEKAVLDGRMKVSILRPHPQSILRVQTLTTKKEKSHGLRSKRESNIS